MWWPCESQHFRKRVQKNNNILENTTLHKTLERFGKRNNNILGEAIFRKNKTPFPNTQRHFGKTQHFRKHAIVLENTNKHDNFPDDTTTFVQSTATFQFIYPNFCHALYKCCVL